VSKPTEIDKALAALLKSARQKRKNIEEAPPRDATTQLAVSFFQWQATRDLAEQAIGQVLAEMVDINELRVSHLEEIVEVVGADYPLIEERVPRMRDALNEVFRREHGIDMASVEGKSKKDQRAYLETLPGAPPYVVSQVMLLAFGGHAVPVDEKLLALLVREGVLAEGLTCAEAEAQLMKHVKAADALDTHLVLQAWADGLKMPETAMASAEAVSAVPLTEPTAPTPAEPEAAAAAPAVRKSVSKKSASKTPAKKTTKKKPPAPAGKKTPKKKSKSTKKKTAAKT
jgi:endonuclease III